ncbi:hypothetical protein PG993_014142 [Apiospora rasikravindrae]|uniref:Uncharacterized protein n=1 Tax=Apiospora rasikravindrae TaxID=990691 RepID=A0ABR1RS67_9PEZI
MRTTFFTALAFGGLVATSVASPIASPVEPVAPEVETQGQVYDDDYGYQGGVLESVLEQISNHVSLVTPPAASILDGVTGVASPTEALGLVGQIAPQLGAVTSLLDNIPVFGKIKYGQYARDVDGVEAGPGYGKDKKPGYKQQCSKLCIFDLVGKLVLQVHELVTQCVNKVGLVPFPLALTLIKTLSSFDMVIGGVLEPVQGLVNQMLGKLGSGLLGGFPGLGSGKGGGY